MGGWEVSSSPFHFLSILIYEREVNAEIKTVEKGKLILPDRCIMVPILTKSNILFFLITMSAEHYSIKHNLSLENSLSSLSAFLKVADNGSRLHVVNTPYKNESEFHFLLYFGVLFGQKHNIEMYK